METWKLLVLTVLSAVVLGCVIGVATGKHQVKKSRAGYKPLLNVKERIIYSLCIMFGAACILFGVLVAPGLMNPQPDMLLDEFGNPIAEGEMIEGGTAGNTGGAPVRRGGGPAVYREAAGVAVEVIG